MSTDTTTADPTVDPAAEAQRAQAEAMIAEAAEAAKAENVPQPAEADPEANSKDLVMHTPMGALTLRPGQTSLDRIQIDALVAIGIDIKSDPSIEPHVRPFIHMCQTRSLDPWAREAYLIGRGRGNSRKYTMQVGIDGYRKITGATGRFIRVYKRLWTGNEDDDRYWREVIDSETGEVEMRRVWFDFWPASRGNPGAAKTIIEHYDDRGRVTHTPAVANWEMFAAYKDRWENDRKVIRDGKVVQDLNDMWAKGGPHMLSKCAEALAHRMASPAAVGAFVTHEEMHRLDAIEQARVEEERRQHRTSVLVVKPSSDADKADWDPEAPSGPLPVGETAAEVVADAQEAAQAPSYSDEDRLRLAHREVEFQAEILLPADYAENAERAVRKVVQRRMAAVKRDLAAFTAEDFLAAAQMTRRPVAAKLSQAGREDEARAYAAVPDGQPADVDNLLGAVEADVVPDPADNPDLDADPTQPHRYVEDGGLCGVCGEISDNILHPAE